MPANRLLQLYIPRACIYYDLHTVYNHGLFSLILQICFVWLDMVLFLNFEWVLY